MQPRPPKAVINVLLPPFPVITCEIRKASELVAESILMVPWLVSRCSYSRIEFGDEIAHRLSCTYDDARLHKLFAWRYDSSFQEPANCHCGCNSECYILAWTC